MVYAILALLMVIGSFLSFWRASQYYARRAEEAKKQREAAKHARAADSADGPPPA